MVMRGEASWMAANPPASVTNAGAGGTAAEHSPAASSNALAFSNSPARGKTTTSSIASR
jgi:hypothetical protein